MNFNTLKDHGSGVESLLDPCLSTVPEWIVNTESQGLFSDHAIYTVDIKKSSLKSQSTELVPDWPKADFNQLAVNLATVEWDIELELLSGLDSWEFLKDKIDSETNKCVPLKRRIISSRPLWMTKNVMRLVRKKKRLWRWYSSYHSSIKKGF